MDAACVLENTGGTKIMQIFTEVGDKFYENVDQTFLVIVTAGKSRDLIMHVGYLHCIGFLSQMHQNFFSVV
jgi:predicted nucleic acid-binding Zn finger protein